MTYFIVVALWCVIGVLFKVSSDRAMEDDPTRAPWFIHLMFWPLSLLIGFASVMDQAGIGGFSWWQRFENPETMFVAMTVFIVPVIAAAFLFFPWCLFTW